MSRRNPTSIVRLRARTFRSTSVDISLNCRKNAPGRRRQERGTLDMTADVERTFEFNRDDKGNGTNTDRRPSARSNRANCARMAQIQINISWKEEARDSENERERWGAIHASRRSMISVRNYAIPHKLVFSESEFTLACPHVRIVLSSGAAEKTRSRTVVWKVPTDFCDTIPETRVCHHRTSTSVRCRLNIDISRDCTFSFFRYGIAKLDYTARARLQYRDDLYRTLTFQWKWIYLDARRVNFNKSRGRDRRESFEKSRAKSIHSEIVKRRGAEDRPRLPRLPSGVANLPHHPARWNERPGKRMVTIVSRKTCLHSKYSGVNQIYLRCTIAIENEWNWYRDKATNFKHTH